MIEAEYCEDPALLGVSFLEKLNGSNLVSDGDHTCGLLTRHLVPLQRRVPEASRSRDPLPHRPSHGALTFEEGYHSSGFEGIEIGGTSRLCVAVSTLTPSLTPMWTELSDLWLNTDGTDPTS